MMIPIEPPTCSCCESKVAKQFESATWPGFFVCKDCQQRVAVWLLKRGLADGNPFAEELLSTDSEGDSYFVWHPSLDGPSNSFSETSIRRVHK